jgi:hypothetical protein
LLPSLVPSPGNVSNLPMSAAREEISQRGRNGLGDATAFSNDRLNSVAIEQRHRNRPSQPSPSYASITTVEVNACGGLLVQCPIEGTTLQGTAADVPIDLVIRRSLVP